MVQNAASLLVGLSMIFNLYDDFPKQYDLIRQDQPTDLSHPAYLEGTERI